MEKRYSVNKKSLRKAALAVVILMLAIIFIRFAVGEKVIPEYSSEYVAMAELPSQLSFTYFEEAEWKDKIKEINGGKNLNGKLTFGKLEKLLEQLSVQEYVTCPKGFFWKQVSRSEWNGVYEQILDLLDTEGRVSAKNLVFLMDEKEEQNEDGSSRRLTQKGYYEVAEGINYFHAYDMYQVYVMGNRMIGISSECKGPLMLKNVFVHTSGEEKAELLFEHQKISLNIAGLTENITNTICDLEWTDGRVTSIYKKEDLISGKVLSFNEEQIEISGYGTLEHNGALKIYKTYGTVEELDESKLVIGNLKADFVVADKQVCGIILKEPASIEIVRVLLLNEEGTPYHEDPVFVTDAGGTLTIGDRTQPIESGQPVKAAEFFEKDSDYLKIALENENGRIYFSDASGTHTSLGYQGTMEIRKYPEGYGTVNELSLEQYLYGVVPSEMPSSYEREALCVQAVCARSYACIQLMKGDYAALGAHVDDSTSYQVYNKQEGNEQTKLAVDDTVGEVIKYQGEIAEAYFFSTSCGHTGNMGLWNTEEGGKYGYLQGISLLTDDSEPGLEGEENFAEFIKSSEVNAYDKDSPYFRWQAEVFLSKSAEAINKAVEERAQASPGNVQILKQDGSEGTVAELPGFGGVKELSVAERGAGGGIRTLCVSYEKGTVNLLTEYNIRCVLGAAAVNLKNQAGETLDMQLLPSAYCTLTPVQDGYVLYGGGYGHGIGMSQNGANGMAKEGMSYIEILMKFYQNITIENIYNEE